MSNQPQAAGDLCAELAAAFSASQGTATRWTPDTLRQSAASEPAEVRAAVDVIAEVAAGRAAQHRSADVKSPHLAASVGELMTQRDVVAWWESQHCGSGFWGWAAHDPQRNPAGLTEAALFTADGSELELPARSPYEMPLSRDGRPVDLGAGPSPERHVVMLLADVDRECFGLARYVHPAPPVDGELSGEAERLAAVVAAGTQKRCSNGATDGTPIWSGTFDGWVIEVVESPAGTPRPRPRQQVVQLTESRFAVATAP